MPAKTLTSYLETLLRVLEEFRPRYVLEFGPGISTDYLSTFESVELVETVEHDYPFSREVQGRCYSNVNVIYQPDLDLYAQHKPGFKPEFVFVDGRNRSRCLRQWRGLSPVVMLHDADREKYREAIDEYKFKIWTDDGNTVTLTDDESVFERLKKII